MKGRGLIINKKGVSPLIATVLLIAFAVALGAVVMQWGNSYIRNTQENVEDSSNFAMMCQNVQINILEVGGSPRICYTKKDNVTELSSIIENSGDFDIKGLIIKSISADDNIQTVEVEQDIIVSDAKKVLLNFPPEFGDLQQIEYTPKIKKDSTRTNEPCVKQKLVVEGVYPC